ncbi:MAG TPA: hypothetical protein VGM90_34230 [Kofleriaceae bacterium]|jgi:hypothetical protein
MKSYLETTVEESEARLKTHPNDLPIRERLADAYAAQHKKVQAADMFISAAEGWAKAGRAPMAAAMYQKALNLVPERTELIELIQKLVPPKKR